MSDQASERRKFRRLNAPVFARPAANALVRDKKSVQDISLGGLRVFTDDKHQNGEHLELELFLPDGETLTLDTEVMWIDALGAEGPAKFEVGLRFVDMNPADLARIESLLKDA